MHPLSAACAPCFSFPNLRLYFNSYQKLPSMSFRDHLEKDRDLNVVLSFISTRENNLCFLVHYKNKEHYYYYYFNGPIAMSFFFCPVGLSFRLAKIFQSINEWEACLFVCFLGSHFRKNIVTC